MMSAYLYSFGSITAAKTENREEYHKIQQINYYSKDIIRSLKDLFLYLKLKNPGLVIFMSVYLCLGGLLL